MSLLETIKNKAKQLNKRIVLPEGLEERTLKAANEIISEKIAEIILIGNPSLVNKKSNELGLTNISKATIIDPIKHDKKMLMPI